MLSDNGTSEALLLVDEPGSAQQAVGVNVFAAKKGPQGENSLLFANVPFIQPGSGGSRVFRFTNIRVDASLVGESSSLVPSQILAFLSVNASLSVAIDNPQQTVAFVLLAIQSSVRLPDDTGGSVLLPSCTSQNVALLNSPTATTGTASFDLRFREGVQIVFKTRSSGSDPATPSAQDIPGVVFNTETGFFNPQYPATDGLNKAGLAEHGTRLMARFSQIPPGVKLFVTTSAKTRTISPSTAVLVSTDNAGAGAWAPSAKRPPP